MFNQAVALHQKGQLAEAAALYTEILARDPRNADALHLLGVIEAQRNNASAAIALIDRAIKLNPNNAVFFSNRGNALKALKRLDEALESYAHALTIKPDHADALNNRGIVLQDLNRLDEALESYDRALAIKPTHADALNNRGFALFQLKRFDEAMASYDRALAIKSDLKFLLGMRLDLKKTICDWRGLKGDFYRLAQEIEAGEKISPPFPLLCTPLSAALQRRCSEIYVREKYPQNSLLPQYEDRYEHERIRLGYFSSDFRNHPVAYLTANLFEKHDRTQFEVIGFSFGPVERDAMRMRLENAFDRFFDVGAMSDNDIALLARSLEIDIAVDLNGFTLGNRTNVLAMRAAPIQVNYLGYPGTMGASYIDYLIADATVIPEQDQNHYAEKIVYLPDTYMPTDSTRAIAARGVVKIQCGLPESGFVFCCFNNPYKITPEVFDIWMRLLRRVESGVLWLPQSNDVATRNLKSEAHARLVDPNRLVFAPALPHPEDHLVRLKLGDLFLDTLPYNAHATASDALWAGLPVLTCLGTTFPGRVAASLVSAIGLPELITRNLGEYETLALELASTPAKLLLFRQRLAANRLTHPLFDTARFAKHIETAYIVMWKRHQAGLAPEHIYVRAEAKPVLAESGSR